MSGKAVVEKLCRWMAGGLLPACFPGRDGRIGRSPGSHRERVGVQHGSCFSGTGFSTSTANGGRVSDSEWK